MKSKSLAVLIARMNRVMVEVEGMKAENKQREMQGESMAYWEDSFCIKASELEQIEQELMIL